MIISRTPFRISLFGGGTDYPTWFREHGGAVVGTAIDKYCYITVRRLPPFFEHKSRIVYSQVELVRDVAEIKHPAVRGILADRGIKDGLEIHHDADLPARSGLGSSSAFTVGLLHCLAALDAKMMTKRELGSEAIRIEQDVLKENVGSQDQLWAAYGGFNRIEFIPDGTFSVTPLIMPASRREELQQSIMMFFTGFSRFASDFAEEQIRNIGNRTSQLKAMRSMVDSAVDILVNPKTPLRELGELLDAGWRLKRELAASVTNAQLDEIYEAGCKAGAIGGKLLGAGGGGFMVFLVEPEKREEVRKRLSKLIYVGVGLDNDGSKIVLYQPMGFDVPEITLKQRRLAATNSKWRIFLDHIVDDRGNEVPDYIVVEGQQAPADRITGIALLAEIDGRFVLLRSYRHALGATIWDLPRGFIEAGETAVDAALRELAEETGLRCTPENLVALGVYAPDPGTMAARAALFAAIRCEGAIQQADDELGLQSVHLVEPDKMSAMAASGEIEDAGTLIAYYRFCEFQKRARNP